MSDPTPEEKLQKELSEARTRICYLEHRLVHLGALASFITRYNQPAPIDPEEHLRRFR